MRTIDADMLLSQIADRLPSAKQIIYDLIRDIEKSDNYYTDLSEAEGFKAFASVLQGAYSDLCEIDSKVWKAIKSRKMGIHKLKDKLAPTCVVEIAEHIEPFKKAEPDRFGNILRESCTIKSVSKCEKDCGIQYPDLSHGSDISVENKNRDAEPVIKEI